MPKQGKSYVLATVIALLVVSGLVRIVTGAGPAIALAEEQLAEPSDMAEGVQPPQIEPLLAALQQREARLEARETALEDRLRALALAEEQAAQRLAELEAAEASLRATLAVTETANDNDISRLTLVYENMKPADASGLFEEMTPVFAAGFLVRMNPEAAAAILAGLEPQTAYSISVIIAGRNANAPTQ